ncbi:MAG: PhoH family protein, partial [Clostridiales bacterium]|nr:PhoH family protein [Clostridiales bacterium]
DSFIILDEAQNTTPEQMKMFLTRLGFNSRMVVTGDITQVDLPGEKKSGLMEVMKILRGVDDVAIHTFTGRDVVRHQLVQRIISAYEKYEEGKRYRNHGKNQSTHREQTKDR